MKAKSVVLTTYMIRFLQTNNNFIFIIFAASKPFEK